MRCEDLDARMMELLYEELPAEERLTLEQHLGECARCRAELASLRETRAVARRLLDEAPPPRVRASILAAAEAERSRLAAPAAARAPVPAAGPSFWERLRRRWALPTLATVGAIAVFLLASKLFLDPERTYERGREVLEPSAPQPPPENPAAIAEPARDDQSRSDLDGEGLRMEGKPGKSPPREAEPGAAAATKSETPRARERSPAASSRRAASSSSPADKRFAPPPPPKALGSGGGSPARAESAKGARPAKGQLDDLLADPGVGGLGAAPRGRAAGPSEREDRASSDAATASAKPERPSRAKKAASAAEGASRDLELQPEESPGGAALPPATPSPAPAKAAPPELEALERRRAPERGVRSGELAEAERGSAMQAKQRAEVKSKAAPREAAPVATGELAAGPSPAREARAETLLQRADRLFAEGRWAAAAAAYRELLRQDPRSVDAARWRQRVGIAEARLAAERERPAAPAASPPR